MSDPADLILVNGDVLTLDDTFACEQAVAVRGKTILAAGTDAEILALAGPRTRVIDLAGRTVLPGINDSHLHGAAWALSRPPFALDVGHPAAGSIAAIADAVRRAPGDGWLTGLGWDVGYLPGTVAPPGGVIETDGRGEPAGILKESAQSLVQRLIPPPGVARRKEAIRAAVAALHAEGITSYTEPGLGPGGVDVLGGALSTETLQAYAELAEEGALAARVRVLLLPAPMGGGAADVRRGLAELAGIVPDGLDPRRLAVIGVKIFADGVPPNETAWMHDPYPGGGGHGALCVHGEGPARQQAELAEMIRIAHEAGHQLGVHVTGDRAIDAVVAAFAAAGEAVPREDARHYLIHADFASPRSLAALAARGYGVNMNPAIKWTTADLMDEVVGRERSAYQWPVLRPGMAADLCVLGGDLRAADPHDIPALPVDLTVLDGEIVHERGES